MMKKQTWIQEKLPKTVLKENRTEMIMKTKKYYVEKGIESIIYMFLTSAKIYAN